MIFVSYTMSQINILFVDDHPLIRKAWKFILEQDNRFHLMAECESGEEAIELVKELCPDIVIMDIRMRGINGIEATQLIMKNCPGTKIIGLSYHTLPEYAHEMIKSGAKGYLSKISSQQEIYKAILEVHKGRTYICEQIANTLF
jgi:DNA-binding NarL/FixJ family response regulator